MYFWTYYILAAQEFFIRWATYGRIFIKFKYWKFYLLS